VSCKDTKYLHITYSGNKNQNKISRRVYSNAVCKGIVQKRNPFAGAMLNHILGDEIFYLLLLLHFY
jgi:hypothetical protein